MDSSKIQRAEMGIEIMTQKGLDLPNDSHIVSVGELLIQLM